MNVHPIFSSRKTKIIIWNRVVGPYIAEIGSVAFAALALFAVLAAAAEAVYPGFVINWVSPKFIFWFMAISGLAALWPVPGRRGQSVGWFGRLAALLSALAVFPIAWYYFKSMVGYRLSFSLVVAVSVGLAAYLAANADDSDPPSAKDK